MLQVIHASRHWARTSVACEKEATRLQAALAVNAEDMQSAQAYLADSKAHLEEIELRVAGKKIPCLEAAPQENVAQAAMATADSEESEMEELAGREEALDHRPGEHSVKGTHSLLLTESWYNIPESSSRLGISGLLGQELYLQRRKVGFYPSCGCSTVIMYSTLDKSGKAIF